VKGFREGWGLSVRVDGVDEDVKEELEVEEGRQRMIGNEQLVHMKELGSISSNSSAVKSVGDVRQSLTSPFLSTGILISNEGFPGYVVTA